MIHLEWVESSLPSLRLPRNMIRKASGKIENPHEFIVLFKDWIRTWVDRLAGLKMAELQADPAFASNPEKAFREWKADSAERLFALVRYIRAGERAYQLSYPLMQALAATELPKIRFEEFKLPFSAVYVELPERAFCLQFTDNLAWVAGCYLVDGRPYGDQVVLTPVFAGLALDPCIGFSVPVGVHAGPNGDVVWFPERPGGRGDLADQVAVLYDTVARVALNAMLYATSESPDIVEEVALWRRVQDDYRAATGRRKRELEEKLAKLPRTRKLHLGGSIVLRRGETGGEGAHVAGSGNGRHLTEPQLVAGHFKPRLSERLGKRVWIAPYLRGPGDMAEVIRRKYLMK